MISSHPIGLTNAMSDADEPMMRASHMRSVIDALDGNLGRELAAGIRAEVPEVIAAIENSRGVWLPLALDVRLNEATYALAGAERMRETNIQGLARSAEGPLLRPIKEGLRRLGLGPAHAMRRARNGWNLIYRHCGRASVDVDPESQRVRFEVRDLPSVMRSNDYLHSIGSALEGVMLLTGATKTTMDIRIDGDRCRFDASWEE